MTTNVPTKTLLDLDPATGETIAEIPCADAAAVAAAVGRARAAQPAWRDRSTAERVRSVELAS